MVVRGLEMARIHALKLFEFHFRFHLAFASLCANSELGLLFSIGSIRPISVSCG